MQSYSTIRSKKRTLLNPIGFMFEFRSFRSFAKRKSFHTLHCYNQGISTYLSEKSSEPEGKTSDAGLICNGNWPLCFTYSIFYTLCTMTSSSGTGILSLSMFSHVWPLFLLHKACLIKGKGQLWVCRWHKTSSCRKAQAVNLPIRHIWRSWQTDHCISLLEIDHVNSRHQKH
jgi:hypothetical protein